MNSSSPSSWPKLHWLHGVAAVGLCLTSAFFAGDGSYVCDEPLLIENALEANEQHMLVAHGLLGTRGTTYGPLPTWLYQAYLHFSNDLLGLATWRALVSMSLIALSLWWIFRVTKLRPEFLLIPLCAPWLGLYSRILWDNTFNLPLTALGTAALLAYLHRPSRGPLWVFISCAAASLLVHLMALAWVLPTVSYLVATRRRALWQQREDLALVSVTWLAVALPYLRYMSAHPQGSSRLSNLSLAALAFPLQGGRTLSAVGIADFFGPRWTADDHSLWNALATSSITVAQFAFAAVWLGAALAVWLVMRRVRAAEVSIRSHVAGVALAIAVGQSLLNGLSGKYGFTHYFNATWVAYALLAWLFLDALPRWLGTLAITVWGTSLLIVSLYFAVRVHTEGSSREGYGATLRNQLQVARELKTYDEASAVQVTVRNALRFPQELRSLKRLVPAPETPRPKAQLTVTYESSNPLDGRIKVEAR